MREKKKTLDKDNERIKLKKIVKKQKVQERGITLIALVVTIIILLILAGVTLNIALSDNGLFGKAKKAAEEYKIATDDEQRKIAMAEAAMNLDGKEYKSTYNNEEVTVPIPAGFTVSGIDGENTVEDGLVIIDSEGNEFVWIPVPNVIWDKEEHETISSIDYTPMSEKIEENYVGVLYKFNGSVEVYKRDDIEDNPNMFREPVSVTGDGTEWDAVEENLKKMGILGGYAEFETQMQNDYNEMVVSVEKYHGFYVARYEMSYEDGKAQYKKGKNSWINNTNEQDFWYGYYKKQREFANDYGYENNIQSSMIWGSQYDAIMNWMARKGINILDNNLEFNESRITGSNEADKILNIYDLRGNSYEWTLEATQWQARARRGGPYSGERHAIARRSTIDPLNGGDGTGSRVTLYMK